MTWARAIGWALVEFLLMALGWCAFGLWWCAMGFFIWGVSHLDTPWSILCDAALGVMWYYTALVFFEVKVPRWAVALVVAGGVAVCWLALH